MPSKVVTDAQKVAEGVLSAMETHGAVVTAGVRAKTATLGPAVDAAPLLAYLGAAVRHRLAALLTADNAHQAELSDDDAPRAARDEAASQLGQSLVTLKRTTASLFGEAAVSALSFPSELPKDPALLSRAATQVIEALEAQGLPKPLVPGVEPVAASTWVSLLSARVSALESARAAVTAEADEARATRIPRDAALADLTAALGDATELLRAVARLGDATALVEGVRATAPRSAANAPADDPLPPKPPVAPAPDAT